MSDNCISCGKKASRVDGSLKCADCLRPEIICPKEHDPINCKECNEFSSSCYHANRKESGSLMNIPFSRFQQWCMWTEICFKDRGTCSEEVCIAYKKYKT